MLAIDFGSSNTAAAFRDSRGGVQQISLSDAGWLMPSAVLYSADRTLVGRAAVQGNLADPDGYEPSPKRRLAEREIHLGPGIVAVTDLIAAVLREVVAVARRETGVTPDRVVLTHPDKWAAPMQELLVEAAVQAGLAGSELRLISEASAAAWYYTATARALPIGTRLAVFDFGAGTCDVAVLDKQADQTFNVVYSDGVDGLGGYDLDARIHTWVRYQLAQMNPELADELAQHDAVASRLTLNDQVRNAKEALSEAANATVAVANGPRTQTLTLTRDEFEQLIAPDLDRAVELTDDVLRVAQRIQPIDGAPTIYLTGGSSAIPAVHDRLRAFGRLAALGNPKTVVSQGALHAMAVLWDSEIETVNFVKSRTGEPYDLMAGLETLPASNPELPWWMQIKAQRPDRANRVDSGHAEVAPKPPDARTLSAMAPPRVGLGDEVDVSGFSPPFVTRGDEFLVQVLMHRPPAGQVMSDAARRGVRSLAVALPLGASVDFQVTVPGLRIGADLARLRWLGQADAVQFWVRLPDGFAQPSVAVTVLLSWQGRPLGSLRWNLAVETGRRTSMLEPQGEVVTRF